MQRMIEKPQQIRHKENLPKLQHCSAEAPQSFPILPSSERNLSGAKAELSSLLRIIKILPG